jgi:hypothetical protein
MLKTLTLAAITAVALASHGERIVGDLYLSEDLVIAEVS